MLVVDCASSGLVSWIPFQLGSLRILGLSHIALQGNECPNEQGRSYNAFYDIISEVLQHCFYYILLDVRKSQRLAQV